MTKKIETSLKRTRIGSSRIMMGVSVTKLAADSFRVSVLGVFNLEAAARLINLKGY